MASSSSTSMDDMDDRQPPATNWKSKATGDMESMTPTKTWPELKRQWISWLEQNAEWITHIPFHVELDQRAKRPHEFSFNKSDVQANSYLRRGYIDLVTMSRMIDSHPALAIGSRKELTNKVNTKSPAHTHESIFDIKFKCCLGWRLTMGYTWNKDRRDSSGRQITHVWVKMGFNCVEQWQREMSCDLMLNIVGHAALFGYPLHQFRTYLCKLAPPPPTLPTPLNQQPLAQEKGLAQEQEEKKKTSVQHRRMVAEEDQQEVKEQSAEAEASEQEKVAREKVAEAPPSAEAADVPPASASMQPHVDSQEAEYVDKDEEQQKLIAEQSKQRVEEA